MRGGRDQTPPGKTSTRDQTFFSPTHTYTVYLCTGKAFFRLCIQCIHSRAKAAYISVRGPTLFVFWIHNVQEFRLLPVLTVLGVPRNTIGILIINTINGRGYWRSGNIIYSSRVQAEKTDVVVMDIHTRMRIINTRWCFFFSVWTQPWMPDGGDV